MKTTNLFILNLEVCCHFTEFKYTYNLNKESFQNPNISSSKVFCLKPKISGKYGPNWLYFSGKLYKCLGLAQGYFLDLPDPLEARAEATSKL